ncbi:helix-turn-helix domain-containing protein [Nitratifractor salsuginis]|uniref:helix-turn-helix domain-containing protein n=1 Tax=Nitratifractor salsuginis TaxID=269261 RepID=UPI0005AB5E8C
MSSLIKEVQGALGLTQIELAKKMGVSPATLRRWAEELPPHAKAHLEALLDLCKCQQKLSKLTEAIRIVESHL